MHRVCMSSSFSRTRNHTKASYAGDTLCIPKLSAECIRLVLFSICRLWVSFSHVVILGNLFPESRSFVIMAVTSCIKDTCSNPYLISEQRRICSRLWRHCNEIVTLWKHVTKYKTWMVEFLKKSEGFGHKIARVNSIRIIKSINLFSFCTVFGTFVEVIFLD